MSVEFSVAMPAYNSAKYLPETLDSILNQTVSPAEIIVVDDGSKDDTREVLAAYADRITIVTIENSGPGTARKTAVERGTSNWIALCDSDDIWQPDYLAKKKHLAENAQGIELAFSNFKSFGPGANGPELHLDEAPAGWLSEHTREHLGSFAFLKDAYRAQLYFNVAYPSGTAFSRALYHACGGIRDAYSRWLAEDAEFTRRLSLAAGRNAVYDTEPSWNYRRHAQNYSTPSEFKNVVAGVRILEEHLRLGDIPEHMRAEVQERIIQRRVTAFLRAYWGRQDEQALEVARQIPLKRMPPSLLPRLLHSKARAMIAPRTRNTTA